MPETKYSQPQRADGTISRAHRNTSLWRMASCPRQSILNPLEIEANEVLTRWKGLRSIHKVIRKRRDKKSDKTSEEVVNYISSLTDVSSLKQAIRWALGDREQVTPLFGCHFGHDSSHKRTKNVAQIMDIIQKINLLIIERLKTNMKSSIPCIQKKLARMNPQQLITIQF